MSLSLFFDNHSTIPMGDGDFLYGFFSSVSHLLERDGWGTRFTHLLSQMCDYGVVKYQDLCKLEQEILTIKREWRFYTVRDAIYDYEHPELPIPWTPTDEFNMNTPIDQAFCLGCKAHGYEPITDRLLRGIYNAQKSSSYLSLIDDTGLTGDIEERRGIWQKRGRSYWKEELPFSISQVTNINFSLERIRHPSIFQEAIRNKYKKLLRRARPGQKVTYINYLVNHEGSCPQSLREEYQVLYEQILGTDDFKMIFLDEYPPEEDPNKPLKYEF